MLNPCHLRRHRRLVISAGVGLATSLLMPASLDMLTRGLLGWNTGVWLYLLTTGRSMFRSDANLFKKAALARAESALSVLTLVVLAAIASLVAIVFELSTAKASGGSAALSHVFFVLVTVAGSWLLVPTLFALSYASVYYSDDGDQGLRFPENDKAFTPDYADFLYFSFTIAVASQTSDVSVTTRPMRRLVLLQSMLAFGFNTTILAFTINIAASLF